MKTPASEEARIAAWRAERAKIAETDRAARLEQRSSEQIRAARVVSEARHNAARSLIRSVDPVDTGELPAAVGVAARRMKMPKFRINPLLFYMVLVPVAVVAIYLTAFATPLYEAQSVIAITKSSDAASRGNVGLLGSMEGSSNLSEALRADEYIRSQALMDSLEAELGLVSEFSGDAIDPVRRLRTIPLLSLSKRMQFDRFVESSIDVRSGLLTLYVRAPDEEQAITISQAVLRNAEIQVSQLGEQLFENRQSLAAKVRADAERQVAEAQAALVALQLEYQEVDPRVRVANIYSRIKDLEDEAQRLRSEIQAADVSGVRNSARTEALIEREASIRDQITRERAHLVAADGSSETPLNKFLMEYELASLNVELAREAVKSAIEAQSVAGQEAALNRSLFQVVVPPRTAQTPVYPKIPGILALALVVCIACYSAVSTLRDTRT